MPFAGVIFVLAAAASPWQQEEMLREGISMWQTTSESLLAVFCQDFWRENKSGFVLSGLELHPFHSLLLFRRR